MQLVNIDDGYLSLMDDSGDTREDLKVPEGALGKEISDRFDNDESLQITVLKAMSDECAIAVKSSK